MMIRITGDWKHYFVIQLHNERPGKVRLNESTYGLRILCQYTNRSFFLKDFEVRVDLPKCQKSLGVICFSPHRQHDAQHSREHSGQGERILRDVDVPENQAPHEK